MARTAVIYCPIQMVADLPENYAKLPGPFRFIRDVPVDWVDTRVLNGEVLTLQLAPGGGQAIRVAAGAAP